MWNCHSAPPAEAPRPFDIIHFAGIAGGTEEGKLQLALLRRFHWLTYLPARLIGVGIRPERVRTGEVRV